MYNISKNMYRYMCVYVYKISTSIFSNKNKKQNWSCESLIFF